MTPYIFLWPYLSQHGYKPSPNPDVDAHLGPPLFLLLVLLENCRVNSMNGWRFRDFTLRLLGFA